MDSVAEEVFPFESFREKQFEVTDAALRALFSNGYKNLVIDAPVGVGKSGINTALLRKSEDGFYTTPQSSLRQQLEDDEVLNDYIKTLKARRDYTCKVSGENCEECPINTSADQSCSEMGSKCTYWGNKMASIGHDIAATTFSYLIIDGMLPAEIGDQPISFGDRDMIVVDEAQSLIGQTASLHAGYKISPYSMPYEIFKNLTRSVSFDANRYEDVEEEVNMALLRCKNFIDGVPEQEMNPDHKKCKRLLEKIQWMKDQLDNDKPWVVDIDTTKYAGQKHKTIEMRPIDVSGFLRNFVWSRGDKRVISTATLPYRGRPEIWLRRVGLDPEETKVISAGMPFPVQNRPIHTSKMIGKMSSGGAERQWDEIMATLNEIAQNHYNNKGLVHTVSYDRATKVVESISEEEHPYLHENVVAYEGEKDPTVFIEDWQNSNHDIALSPSMMEGVDLVGDKARYQVLLKVPLGAQDSRTKYILNNTDWGWQWYWEQAMIKVAQAYGRAIRSKEDYADFYVLDSDFNKLLKRRTPPQWLEEAIDVREPDNRSLFDY